MRKRFYKHKISLFPMCSAPHPTEVTFHYNSNCVNTRARAVADEKQLTTDLTSADVSGGRFLLNIFSPIQHSERHALFLSSSWILFKFKCVNMFLRKSKLKTCFCKVRWQVSCFWIDTLQQKRQSHHKRLRIVLRLNKIFNLLLYQSVKLFNRKIKVKRILRRFPLYFQMRKFLFYCSLSFYR